MFLESTDHFLGGGAAADGEAAQLTLAIFSLSHLASVPWPPCQAIKRDGQCMERDRRVPESLPLRPRTNSSQMPYSRGSQEAQEPRPLPQCSVWLLKSPEMNTSSLKTLWRAPAKTLSFLTPAVNWA